MSVCEWGEGEREGRREKERERERERERRKVEIPLLIIVYTEFVIVMKFIILSFMDTLLHTLHVHTYIALLSMAVAAFTQFIPLYHIFHDFSGVHTGVCLTIMLALYLLLMWSGDRQNGTETRSTQTTPGKCNN